MYIGLGTVVVILVIVLLRAVDPALEVIVAVLEAVDVRPVLA